MDSQQTSLRDGPRPPTIQGLKPLATGTTSLRDDSEARTFAKAHPFAKACPKMQALSPADFRD
jgi:hypothetical protein